MARRLIFKDLKSDCYVGEFPHNQALGFESGKRGIRRRLCKIEEIEGLSDDGKTAKLSSLYHAAQFSYYNKTAIEKTKTELKKKSKTLETVLQASKIYLSEIDPTGTNRTHNEYKKSIELYLKAVGDFELRHYDRDEHNAPFFAFLSSSTAWNGKRPYSRNTQNKHQRHIQGFFNWCKESGRIKTDVKIKKQTRTKTDIETYTLVHLDVLRRYIETSLKETVAKRYSLPNGSRIWRENERWIINYKNLLRAMLLGQNTLMRSGAMWSLKLDKIDLKTKTVKIRDNLDLNWVNKWKKWPNKPINETLFTGLQNDLINRPSIEKYYLDNGSGGPWYLQEGDISELMGRVMHNAGLPPIKKPFHWGIRGSMCTELLLAGENPVKVQQLMDHESLDTTMGYFNTRRIDQTDIVNAIPNLMTTHGHPLKLINPEQISNLLTLH
ncbi:tyrosine-type recombinase/integrase [Pseudomonas sp. HK3]